MVYPELDEGATTIVPSTEDLKSMTKLSLGRPDVLPLNKIRQEEQNDSHGFRIESSAKDREQFFKMQESINKTVWMQMISD